MIFLALVLAWPLIGLSCWYYVAFIGPYSGFRIRVLDAIFCIGCGPLSWIIAYYNKVI